MSKNVFEKPASKAERHKRALLKKEYHRESKLVAEESMKVLHEFEALYESKLLQTPNSKLQTDNELLY